MELWFCLIVLGITVAAAAAGSVCTTTSGITTCTTKGNTNVGWVYQDMFTGIGCPGTKQTSRIGYNLGVCTSQNTLNAVYSVDITANKVASVYYETYANMYCNTTAMSVVSLTSSSGIWTPSSGSFNGSCGTSQTGNYQKVYVISTTQSPVTLSLPTIPSCTWSNNMYYSQGSCSGIASYFSANCYPITPTSAYCQTGYLCINKNQNGYKSYTSTQNAAACPFVIGGGCTSPTTCKTPPGSIGTGYITFGGSGGSGGNNGGGSSRGSNGGGNGGGNGGSSPLSGCNTAPYNLYTTQLGVCTIARNFNGAYGVYSVLPSMNGGFSRVFLEIYFVASTGTLRVRTNIHHDIQYTNVHATSNS